MDVTHMLRKKMPTRKDHKKKAAEKVSKFVAQGVTDTIALQEDLENRLQIWMDQLNLMHIIWTD